MSVPSTTTPIETPASANDLWSMALFFEPDWKRKIVVRTAWSTDITAAKSDAEHRRGLVGRPSRTIEATFTSMSRAELLGTQALIQRSGNARWLIPLYPDQTKVVNGGSALIQCSPGTRNFRRFVPGGRVAIYDPQTKQYEVATVSFPLADSLILTSTLTGTYGTNALVYPLIEAKVVLEARGSHITDIHSEVKLEASELPGPWCLDASSSLGGNPAGFATREGYPILRVGLGPNFAQRNEFGLRRTGNYAQSGISQTVDVYGPRMRYTRGLNFSPLQRPDFWSMMQFFDSRGGRLFPFWVASPSSDYEVVALGSNTIQVKAVGAEIDWDFRPYVGITYRDGSVAVREITGVVRASGVDTLTLDSTFSGSNISHIGLAHLMRFDSDELVEEWSSTDACAIDVDVIEVVNEKEVDLGIVEPEVASGTDPFNPTDVGEYSGVEAPMHFTPCSLPDDRPSDNAAPLKMPQTVSLRILDEFTRDDTFPILSGQVSDELLEALPDVYKLVYVGAIGGSNSRHWHHVRVLESPSLGFGHFDPSQPVTRHLWQATKGYVGPQGNETITVDMIVEWSTDIAKGARGALINFYIYASEVNRSYSEGAAFAPRNNEPFTVEDPAVWGPLAAYGNEVKVCHPKMLICASVPTTWEAPCGNQGWACNEAGILQGFDECYERTNGAPWVGNTPSICPNNVVFPRENPGSYAACTLGGGCPESEFMELVIVENRREEGITALKPARSGWDEDTGELNYIGGSSLELTVCIPAQDRISCCDPSIAAPNCWSPGPGASSKNICDPPHDDFPNTQCCFKTNSRIILRINQKCVCHVTHFGADCLPFGGCPDEFPYSVCATLTRELTLLPCSILYDVPNNGVNRVFKWNTHVVDPDYVFENYDDDFDATDPLSWSPGVGSWSLTSGTALCSAAGTSAPLSQFLALANNPGEYRNSVVEVDVLNNAEAGVAVRTSTTPSTGLAVLVSPTAGRIRWYSLSGTTKTLINEVTGITIPTPYHLRVQAQGETLRATIDDDTAKSLTVKNCNFTSAGYVALIADGSTLAEFDNFEITDQDADLVEVVADYTPTSGWHGLIPAKAMPLWGHPSCQSEIPEGCGTTICPCDSIFKARHPDGIEFFELDPSVSYAGQGKPYEGNGGPGSNQTCCGCTPPGEKPRGVTPDWLAVTLRLDPPGATCLDPDQKCPEGSFSTCVGVDVWYGFTIVEV